jgi:hypothetical protein
MTGRRALAAGHVVALVITLRVVAAPTPALAAGPELVAAGGYTVAVEGEPGDGGVSLALSLLWGVEDHFRFGVMGFADDLGERQGRLLAPGEVDLGPVSALHRDAMGIAWRMEAHAPSSGDLDAFVTATWGGYRVTDDQRGTTLRTVQAAGVGVGVGLARRVAGSQAVGLLARYQQLSRGGAPRYLSVAVEWRRHRSAGR